MTREFLRELMDECLVVVRSRLSGIQVDIDVNADIEIEVVRSQFGQVLMNLIANAADAVNDERLSRGDRG